MCDVFSRYLSNFSSAGQIASDADGLVNFLRRMLQNGEFWLRFDFVKSPRDGHWIIHSLKTCLNSSSPNCTTTYDLLEMLSLECITRSARYLPCYYVGDIKEFYQETEQYVRYKKYDTHFCDIVLNIMSNVLKRIIFVIDRSDVGLNVYAITPCDHNQITDTTLSDELGMDSVVLYREGDHYDACVKVYPCRTKMITDCDVDSAGTEYQPCESKARYGEIAPDLSPSGKFENTAATEFPISGDRNEYESRVKGGKCHVIGPNDGCDHSDDNDPAVQVKTFRGNHAKILIIGHYNVDSIRHQFSELQHILHRHFVDILGIAETKIDDSFFDGQFQVDNYKLYRQDRNSRGGGIMMYINDNTPHRLLKQFSGIYHGIDFLTFEIITKSRKWYISYLYWPPNVNESILCDLFKGLCEEFISNNNLYVAYGDLNCNWFKPNALSDLCEIYGMVNLIEQPTCFKGENPILVDVFLTNKPKCFSGVCNADLGTSDCHNCICLRRHILSTRLHIGVWNIFLKMLFRIMLILSPSKYVIYLTILTMPIGCMINYSCQYWTNMLPLKLKLWKHRFHTWTPNWDKPLIK